MINPIIKYGTGTQSRIEVREYLSLQKFKRVLDVGYSANSWSKPFVTHTIDIMAASMVDSLGVIQFFGDANEPDVWELIKEDVEKHGPFDFCIASHVLEDIVNPVYAATKISQVCSAGFVSVPSKFLECTRHIESTYRGFIHHRYIYNAEGDTLVGYPKLNFIEYDSRFDTVSEQLTRDNLELQLWWEDKINLKIVNGNFMGPNVGAVLGYYDGLLK